VTDAQTARRRQNRRGEGEQLRGEIMRAALGVLDDSGSVEAVTLRGVASAAGITAPAIYSHFSSLKSLLVALRDAAYDQVLAESNAAAAAASTPAAALIFRCTTYVELGIKYPARRQLMYAPIGDSSNKSGAIAFAALVAALDECVRQGLSGSIDTRADAAILIAALHGIAATRTTSMFPLPPLPEAIRQITSRITRLSE
jgi:AcrR family transcriptional regulator